MKFNVFTEKRKITVHARNVACAENVAARMMGGELDTEMRHIDCDCCLEAVAGIRIHNRFEAFLGVFPVEDNIIDCGDSHFEVAGVLV